MGGGRKDQKSRFYGKKLAGVGPHIPTPAVATRIATLRNYLGEAKGELLFPKI